MCLICIEYHKKKMTKEEVKKALPEMIMFAKSANEKLHFEKLSKSNDKDFELIIEDFINTEK